MGDWDGQEDRPDLTTLDLHGRVDPQPAEESVKVDVPYRVWFVIALIGVLPAVFSGKHYELFAKIAWTLLAPGFTLSQTWNYRRDPLSILLFGALLLAHLCLMALLFPIFPFRHFGYILVAAIVEIMTLGLAYQVWIHLHSTRDDGRKKPNSAG